MAKKVTIYILLLTFIVLITNYTEYSVAYACIGSSAGSMVLIETNNNRVLYSKNEYVRRPMASTTKIMTAITVIDNVPDLDRTVKIARPSTIVEGTSIYLKEGEELTIRQLLYGLMLQSGNDAAHALAVEVGGSVDGFACLMNEMAEKIGVKDTHFVNPHGLDHPDHYTTAYDLAIITSYALKNQVFREIVSSRSYVIEGDNVTKRYLKNKNRLLNSLDGCIGVKTGYTSRAGRCLVSACERDGMQVVCVVLNCGPMFEESAVLIEQAYEEYNVYQVVGDNSILTDVPVINGDKPYVHVFTKQGYKVVSRDTPRYNVEYELPNSIDAPISSETKIGKIKVYDDKDLIFESDLYTLEEVKNIEPKSKIKDILDNWYRG